MTRRKRDFSDLEESASVTSRKKSKTKKQVEWGGEIGSSANEDETVEDTEEELKGPILSLVFQRFCLGIAYYDPSSLVLSIAEDVPCPTPQVCIDVVDSILTSANPSLVYTSFRTDIALLTHLQEGAVPSSMELTVHIKSAKEFSFFRGKQLLSLVTDESTIDPTRHKIGCSVLPPIFSHLQKLHAPDLDIEVLSDDGRMSDEESAYRAAVRRVEVMGWDEWMWIGGDGAESLQIFQHAKHANSFEKKTLEGLSLFGILNQTSTRMGSLLLRTWLHRPSRSLSVINSRLDAVSFFLAAPESATNEMRRQLKGAKNARKALGKVMDGKGTWNDWRGVWTFFYAAVMVRDVMHSCVEEQKTGRAVRIVKEVLGKIDWDESSEQRPRICVKSDVDEILDEKRRIYAGMDSMLGKIANELAKDLPVEEFNCVYFPQLGFLCALPIDRGWTERELRDPVPGKGWDFQFSTEESAYYKSSEMKDLDAHIGDIYTQIAGREIEIVQSLQQRIAEHSTALYDICSAFAELDVLLCFAHVSKQYNYNRPTMTEENVCRLKQARHPLVELTVDHYIPNDVSLEGGKGILPGEAQEMVHDERMKVDALDPNHSMLILTGANFSGKSVFLKQVALIVVMAHIGCFVPAQTALISLTDRIITRTLQVLLSALHMTFYFHVFFSLPSADGAALFAAVVEHLLEKGPDSPKTAEKKADIFANKILNLNMPVGLAHMEILLPPQQFKQHFEAQITLRPGLALTSHAALCASLFGISQAVLDRATKVTDCINRFALVEILDDTMTEKERDELIEGEEMIRRLLEWNLDEWEEETNGLLKGLQRVIHPEKAA
ncbi:hypothetical protein BT69DRAFT_1333617 [Atractiella rhizophila]|nr:hypothetical protein BT69DRAFT_1333617 [Atractiella rhizophila]